MLSDEPRPEDLPEPQPSPYAALPPELAHRAPSAGEQPRPDGLMGSTLRKVVAAIAVIALLAATLLAVWGLFRSSEPVAGDAWSRTGSVASAGRHRLPGCARRLLHPARRLEVVR